jgi:hypothetical protein
MINCSTWLRFKRPPTLLHKVRKAVKSEIYVKVKRPDGQDGFDVSAIDIANNSGAGLQSVKMRAMRLDGYFSRVGGAMAVVDGAFTYSEEVGQGGDLC